MGKRTNSQISVPLTNVSLAWSNADFKAREVLNSIPVNFTSAFYWEYDKTAFQDIDDTVSETGEVNRISRGWRQVPVRLEERGIGAFISDREREELEQLGMGTTLEADETEHITERTLLKLEQRVFGSNGLLRASGNNIYDSDSINWSDLATSNPRLDIEAAITAIDAATAIQPNTIVLTHRVARQIMNTEAYKSERQYVADLSTTGGVNQMPTEFYGLRAVYVQAAISSTRRGQNTSLTKLFGEDVWIGYVNPNPTLGRKQLTFGAIAEMPRKVLKYYVNERRGTAIDHIYDYALVRVAKECGGILRNVLS